MKIKRVVILSLCFIALTLSCNENATESEEYANQLLLYLPFYGNADDASGNGNHASVNNAVLTADRFGRSDSAYYFNGTNSFLSIQNSNSLSIPNKSISICAWIRISDWYDYGWAPILTKSNTSDYGMYTMMILPDNLEIVLNNKKIWYPYSFNLNTWYFVVFTWDGSKTNCYINNNHIGTGPFTSTLIQDSNPLIIGMDTPEITEYFKGVIDEIRIYNYALNNIEINNLYQQN